MSSTTTTTTTTSNVSAGRSSLYPFTFLRSTAASCTIALKRLFGIAATTSVPRFTVCGISATEAEVNYAVKQLAKRVKKSEKELGRKKSRITRVTKQRRKLRDSRDQWRRIAQMQTARAEEREAEAEEQTFEVEMSATVTRHQRRVGRLEAQVEVLRTECDNARNENQDLEAQLQPFRAQQAWVDEFRFCPILMEPLVMSPVEDTHACAIAKAQALAEYAKKELDRTKERLGRAQSLSPTSAMPELWGQRLQPVQSERGASRGFTD